MKSTLIQWAEQGRIPDPVIRAGIRRLHHRRLETEKAAWDRNPEATLARFTETLAEQPIAMYIDDANDQHYEVPTTFFKQVLGPRLKYSGCLFEHRDDSLGSAEERMLALTCSRAQLSDGLHILELGCGWGSLSLYMAERFPNALILAVSNSSTQKAYIDREAERRGILNLTVVTANIADFQPPRRFDRIVSVEMFEHMRNYRQLMSRIETWLQPNGKLFVHIFCHRRYAYLFEESGPNDWMTKFFFRGGTMPSYDLLPQFRENLLLDGQWQVNGIHYSRTLEAWLKRMDRQRDEVADIFAAAYGADVCRIWIQRWRMFFLACSELFRYRGGKEWFVAHYRFAKG